MAPMDPQQLLKALNPLLGPTGAILGPTEAVRIASLMKDATKLVSKCIYINILKIETSQETMEKFLSVSGWDTLNEWLQEAKEEDNYPFLVEVLKVYKTLPVTVEILKKNSAAKTIKQLTKAENEDVKVLAFNIFDVWMKKVKGNNNNNDSKLKKKKKDKEKGTDKDSEGKEDKKDEKDSKEERSDKKDEKDSERKSEHSKGDKSKHRDSKYSSRHSSHSSHHSSHRDKDRDKERDKEKKSEHAEKTKDKNEEEEDGSGKSDMAGDDVVSVRKGEGLKLTIKIGGEKDTSPGKGEVVKKRASTVKRPPSKFRSTGLEDQAIPPKTPKLSAETDTSKSIPKRTGSDIKSDLPIKRSRLNMPPPLSVPMTTTVTTPTSVSPVSPSELHGKIKIIPARPRPSNHEIHESSGFMDSLETSTRTYGAFKKKRKLSAQGAGGNFNAGNSKMPTTPPSPVSPTTAVVRGLPLVPSFYKDIQQEQEPSPDKEIKTEDKIERSVSPVEMRTEGETTPNDNLEPSELKDPVERSRTPDLKDPSESKETKGLLTTGATKVKKKKKSVTWKDDCELREVFFFELDETERENVNRPKDFNQAKKQEMLLDRRAMESARRFTNDNMVEQIAWYRPRVVMGYKVFEAGNESVEKTVQKLREQSVLQALYFNRNMLPDGPQEPDLEHEEPVEAKQIPLEDVSGGDEFLYNYDQHAQVVTTKPQSQVEMQQPPPLTPQPQGGPGPGQVPPLNLPPGVMPPELMNMLNQFQQSHNPNDPMMNQVHQIINNLMCGGPEQNFEQLLQQIQQIMNSQIGMPPNGMMQGPPPGMGPPMGPPMQNQGPPMGPRGGLLGTAPPGFMPQRQMGPNMFPQGPQGNWGQNNMGGGPGPQFNRMRGPRPDRGGRGGGRGGGPGALKRRNVLCRHFANGSCRLGSDCGFLHPGVNGPPPNFGEPVQMDNMGT